ncbi:MAG: peptide chain release factor N(5)-glutamine methyltransferase [Vulcanimicrobiaceae bacterium]
MSKHASSQVSKPSTVAQVLARGIFALVKSSDSARTDAQILLAHSLKKDRSWLVAHGESFLTPGQAERYERLIERRSTGMPIAYMLGSAGFFGREFVVNDHVLIPRPESESLVIAAIAFLRSRVDPLRKAQILRVLDIGIGSGALGCSIAAEVPQAAVEGIDISAEALAVATQNARRLHVHRRCTFVQGDLAAPVAHRSFDLVVANLPYVPTAEIAVPPDPVSFEPRLALDGGPDGLDLYRRLLAVAPALLYPGGVLLLEAAPPLMAGLQALAVDAFPGAEVTVGCDLGGQERYVRVQASLP